MENDARALGSRPRRLSNDGGGFIASGGSIATLAAVCTARDAHGSRAGDYEAAVVYARIKRITPSSKRSRIAGMAEAERPEVPMDDATACAPRRSPMLFGPTAQRSEPWMVVAAAGTTDTGAVDPLEAIGSTAQREGCWYHVDAAYGGFFLLTEHGRSLLRGIERSDSAILDPIRGCSFPTGREFSSSATASGSPRHTGRRGSTCRTRGARAPRFRRRSCLRSSRTLPRPSYVAAARGTRHEAVLGSARGETVARAILLRRRFKSSASRSVRRQNSRS